MTKKIKIKRGLEAALPTLQEGEPGFTTDSKKLFIGSNAGNIEIGALNILDAPLKSIKWPAMHLWTILSVDSPSPERFSKLLSAGLMLTYRAFHYSFDLSFSYTLGDSESNTIELHNPMSGELIYTFHLVDGPNILHFEWEDPMGNTADGSGSEFTLKMSVNGGVEQTASSYLDAAHSKMLIFDISTDHNPHNPLVTNLILY